MERRAGWAPRDTHSSHRRARCFSAHFHTWGNGAAPHGPAGYRPGDPRCSPLTTPRQREAPPRAELCLPRVPAPLTAQRPGARPHPTGSASRPGGLARGCGRRRGPPLPPHLPRRYDLPGRGARAARTAPTGAALPAIRVTGHWAKPSPGSRYTSPTPSESGAGGRHLSSGSETALSTQTPSDPGPSRDTVSWYIAPNPSSPPASLVREAASPTFLPPLALPYREPAGGGARPVLMRKVPFPFPSISESGRDGASAGSARWGWAVVGAVCAFGSSLLFVLCFMSLLR